MYTTILFDFFDVIHADPFKAWLRKHNFSNTEPYFALMEKQDAGELSIDQLLEKYSELSRLPLKEVIDDFAHKPLLDERMPVLIKRLGMHYKLGLLTNASTEEIEPVLAAHGYRDLFNYVFISGEVGLIKPSVEAFHHTLEKLGSKPSETIFIDDSESNVRAASDIGIKSLSFIDYDHLETDLENLGIELD